MRYYFAPLEGITDDVFRSLHHRYFPGVDRYYTPFLSPTSDGPAITKKDLRQVLPENNSGFELVPQLLTNQPGPFLQAAEKLKELGYQEVNLNLGCPSGTVTAKGKGSGFLAHPDKLRAFLDEVFEKTRIFVHLRAGRNAPPVSLQVHAAEHPQVTIQRQVFIQQFADRISHLSHRIRHSKD